MSKIKPSVNGMVESARKALAKKSKPESILQDSDFVSSGITLIDLACYGRIGCAFAKGHIYRLAGRASGGKTMIAKTIFAEATKNPEFDDYQLIYDDIEEGALMDDARFFGKAMAQRTRPPAYTKGKKPLHSHYIGDFYCRVNKFLDEGKKFIWIADSLDALVPDKESKMTDNKAKAHSQEMRRLMGPIARSGSILIVVSQARVNMGSTWLDDDITAGGRALEHYPSLEIWLRKTKTLKENYRGLKFSTGSIIRAQIKKNRISGKDRTVFFPFSPTYGIDDIGANINYLQFVKHWKGPKKNGEEDDDDSDDEDKSDSNKAIIAPEFEFEGKKRELLQKIEGDDLQRELQVLVGRVWNEIEKAISIERKPRYQ